VRNRTPGKLLLAHRTEFSSPSVAVAGPLPRSATAPTRTAMARLIRPQPKRASLPRGRAQHSRGAFFYRPAVGVGLPDLIADHGQADAFAAITATLPEGLRAQARPDGKGGYLIVLPRATYSTGETLDYTIRRLRALGLWPSMAPKWGPSGATSTS
jgi:hypothetical protein